MLKYKGPNIYIYITYSIVFSSYISNGNLFSLQVSQVDEQLNELVSSTNLEAKAYEWNAIKVTTCKLWEYEITPNSRVNADLLFLSILSIQ